MREMLKGLLSVLIHFTIGFICCLCFVFFFKKSDVLPQLLLKWRFVEAGILFIRFMPSLLVSSILIGYAVIFGTCGQNTVQRYSGILLRYLKEVFIILFFCITVYTVLVELVSPMLLGFQRYSGLKTQDYYDFITSANLSLKNEHADEAYSKVRAALGIWPDNPDALKLLETVKILREAQSSDQKNTTDAKTDSYSAEPENLSADTALSAGKRLFNSHDFYSAHFYAMKAYNLSSDTSPYREEALRIAAQAWNQIEKGTADLTADFDIRMYQAKKLGYEMMQQGDYIKAYYQFVAAQRMLEQNNPLKRDPDIDRFTDIARQKLLEEVFFIDEAEALPLFEAVRQIRFTVPASHAEPAANVMIDGLSFVSADGGIREIYGRNAVITQYAADGKMKYKYRVPFIKFVPVTDKNGQSVLRMLFQAVDKQNDKIVIRPIPLEGIMPVERQASKLLPFSYSDFELIIAANAGEKTMTLPQLYAFRRIGSQYGFPAQIYHREIFARISDVFLILIISVSMLVLAWSFRIPPHQQFKSVWALSFPVFFAVITGFAEAVRYGARLLITLFTDTLYTFSPVLLLLVYILLFIAGSFLFCAQRSEM